MPKSNADPIKASLAKQVQDVIINHNFIRDMIASEVAQIEVYSVDQLNVQFRVRTRNKGVRYFGLKFSEMM